MFKGAKIGWIMMTASVALSAWMFLGDNVFSNILGAATSGSSQKTAETGSSGTTISGDFEINGTTLVRYNGAGGTVELPDNIKTIAAGAFKDKAITQLTNDDNLTTIEDNAFYHTSLSSYSIPTGLLSLNQGAFRKSSDITAFSGGSNFYIVRGGCIYSDGGRVLYIVPEGKNGSVEVAPGTEIVAKGALEGCSNVTTLYVPKSVKKIKGLGKTAVKTIYGYNGTYAAKYATAKQIKFVAIGGEAPSENNASAGSSSNTAGVSGSRSTAAANTGGTNASNPASTASADTAGASASNETAGVSSATDNTTANTTGSSSNTTAAASSAGTQTGGASRSTLPTDGSAGSANGTHTLDSTPKTADGDIDPRFIFCAALLCAGVAIILFSYRTSGVRYAVSGIRDTAAGDEELD